jgi:toxin ParE1/3/4
LKVKVRWRENAKLDLKEIHATIAEDNPAAARRVVRAIRQETALLVKHPLLGREGRVEGTRELVIRRYSYTVAYQVTPAKQVEVLAVIHQARLWPLEFPL